MLFDWIYTLHQQHLYFSSSSPVVHFPHCSVLCVHRMEMLKALNKLPSLLSSSAQEATFANISPRTLPQFRVEYPIPDILLPPPNIYLTNFLLWKLHICPSTLPICRGQMTVWVPGQCCRQIFLQFGQIFLQFGEIWLQIKQASLHIWKFPPCVNGTVAHLHCRGQMTVWGSMVNVCRQCNVAILINVGGQMLTAGILMIYL